MQTTLDHWLTRLQKYRVPALKVDLERVARLTLDERIPLERFTATFERDPGMAVALMRLIRTLPNRHLKAEVTTIGHALLMVGIDRLKELLRALTTLDRVTNQQSHRSLRRTYARALLGAHLAYEVARLRRDLEPDEVYLAALFHSLAEMLLWQAAPGKMLELEGHAWQREIGREEAETVVLGCSLGDLTRALARRFGLPTLLEHSLHPEAAENPRIHAIQLAVRIAREAEHGWFRPEVVDLIEQLAEAIRYDAGTLTGHLHRAAVDAADRSLAFDTTPAAAWLLLPTGTVVPPPDLPTPKQPEAESAPVCTVEFCLAPQAPLLHQALKEIETLPTGTNAARVIQLAVEALHSGLGLNRVVFAILNPERDHLQARTIAGAEHDTLFSRFAIQLDGVNLFARLMDKPQALWLSDENRPRLWAMMPLALYHNTRINSFYAMSLFVRHKAMGLFYADRHTTDCQLTEHHYAQFKRVVQATANAMTQLAERRQTPRKG